MYPYTIISGIIANITYDNNTQKKQTVIIKLKESLTIVSNDGQSKHCETKSHLESYNLTGIVTQQEIYDKQLVHLNEIIDSNIAIGNEITAMIININLEEKIIYLTFRNSLIKGKSQMFIQGNDYLLNIPFNLGMSIRHESEERNESYLNNKMSQYNINEYGIMNDNVPCLNYEVLRKIQNYDWSDEYISKGDYFDQKGLFILAIENYDEAEKLDPLNTEVYVKKGNACLKMDDIKKAISCYKNCLKIDPNNKEARDYIEKLHSRRNNNKRPMPSNSNEIHFLNKKRKNGE